MSENLSRTGSAGRNQAREGDIRILIVDDESDLLEILQFNLRYEGFTVDTALSGEEALSMNLESYNLFLLDVMMGKMSGFQLADTIRNRMGLEAPIIFLTAKDGENDLLTGFSLGADDYIRKPFSIMEVKARLKAVLSRAGEAREKSEEREGFVLGDLTLNRNAKEVRSAGRVVELTRKEYEILLMLADNSGRYITREEILNKLWSDTVVSERTVDVHVARLRKRLGCSGEYIKSRSGYGYFISAGEEG
jgi:two-component system alkaline phosphatase synthesis response regulator PhoP